MGACSGTNCGPPLPETAARSVLADRFLTLDKPAAERWACMSGPAGREMQPSARGRLRAADRCATDLDTGHSTTNSGCGLPTSSRSICCNLSQQRPDAAAPNEKPGPKTIGPGFCVRVLPSPPIAGRAVRGTSATATAGHRRSLRACRCGAGCGRSRRPPCRGRRSPSRASPRCGWPSCGPRSSRR